MRVSVVFTPEAEAQLLSLYRFIAARATPAVAQRYVSGVIGYCESLRMFPHRGMRRDDIRPGLRITNFRKRVVVAFAVDQDRVEILGVFYGGRDFETSLAKDS